MCVNVGPSCKSYHNAVETRVRITISLVYPVANATDYLNKNYEIYFIYSSYCYHAWISHSVGIARGIVLTV